MNHKRTTLRATVMATLMALTGQVAIAQETTPESPTESVVATTQVAEVSEPTDNSTPATYSPSVDTDPKNVTLADLIDTALEVDSYLIVSGDLVFVDFSQGNWAIVPVGSTVGRTSGAHTDEDGQSGTLTEGFVIPPPETSEPDFQPIVDRLCTYSPDFCTMSDMDLTASEAAVALGLIPAAEAESALADVSGGTIKDESCLGVSNNTGSMYACYVRYRNSKYANDFGVRHWGTADPTGSWLLKYADTGANYNRGTGVVKNWAPLSDTNAGSCSSATVSGTYKGLGLSVSKNLCPEKLRPIIDSNGKYFRSRWQKTFGTFGTRASLGDHWFFRSSGTDSGFKFYFTFFCI